MAARRCRHGGRPESSRCGRSQCRRPAATRTRRRWTCARRRCAWPTPRRSQSADQRADDRLPVPQHLRRTQTRQERVGLLQPDGRLAAENGAQHATQNDGKRGALRDRAAAGAPQSVGVKTHADRDAAHFEGGVQQNGRLDVQHARDARPRSGHAEGGGEGGGGADALAASALADSTETAREHPDTPYAQRGDDETGDAQHDCQSE